MVSSDWQSQKFEKKKKNDGPNLGQLGENWAQN